MSRWFDDLPPLPAGKIPTKHKNDRLKFEERQKIEKLLKHGYSSAAIAAHLGRGKNSVNVEIRRSGGKDGYTAHNAQKLSDDRWQKKVESGRRQWSDEQRERFVELVRQGKSPYAIKREMKISHVTMFGLYKSAELAIPSLYDMLNEAFDKIYALEEQLKILFELVENDSKN